MKLLDGEFEISRTVRRRNCCRTERRDPRNESPSEGCRTFGTIIDRKARLPKPESPKFRFVRYSGDALTAGVEVRRFEQVPVRVYGVAKTVVDCFKYRNKIGLDVALEALRECRRGHAAGMDELWRYAKICRVANVMRPYLESVA